MSCKHDFKEINDVRFCVKCGIHVTFDNKIIFDKKLPSCMKKGEKRCREK